jgi:hypothetical protein
MRNYFLFITLLFAVIKCCGGVSSLPEQGGQLGAPIEWIQVTGTKDQFYMAQRTADGKLILTPNESFFPKLGLMAVGQGKVGDVDQGLNGGASFNSITDWDQGDQAEWGLWLSEAGDLDVRVWMSQTPTKSRYTLSLGDQKKIFSAERTGAEAGVVAKLSLHINEPGRYSLILTCEDQGSDSKPRLHLIEVEGPAAKNSAVLRKRWRPSAAHARFSSSNNLDDVRLWIIEMDAKPGDLGFYCPITTPFGYFGPSWLASGVVNSGFNFSLWSYGRGQTEPPIEQLSHLIAIGNRQATFSGFGHEGTGVKIRDWQPLEGRQGQRQVLALRFEAGEVYDTYFSYFFANDEQRWRLFGVGKKYNKGKLRQSLRVGSFVEVPGSSSKQRTGAYERQMRYRGWVVDSKGKLQPLDRMRFGDIDKSSVMTHTDRGVTDDGWFYLQTGGWIFRKAADKEYVSLTPSESIREVEYLGADDLEFLHTLPCEIVGRDVKHAASGTVVTFNIRNLGEKPEVEIFWGPEEGLTFADRWANKVIVSDPREGNNEFVIKNAPANKPAFVRLFLKNEQGQFWSMNTLKTASR